MSDASPDAAFKRILQVLLEKRGLDFDQYRPTFLERRVEARLQANNVSDFASYENFLKDHPSELNELFDTLTINVAEFFRDPPIWRFLETRVFSPLLRSGKALRIWSAGCASGEEPYSIAIAIKELQRSIPHRAPIKIFATDVDPLAIEKARRGIYIASSLSKVPLQRLKLYFAKIRGKNAEEMCEVVPEIKSMVQFSEHNHLKPPPFPERADVIFCRNSMIYLKGEAKNQVVSHFYRTLVPGGYLILGVTEVLIGELHYSQFHTIKEHPGIFQKRET